MSVIEQIVSAVNNFFWGKFFIYVLILVGLYFSFRTKFVQVRLFKDMVRLLGEGITDKEAKKKSVSSFQAFAMSTASRIGTGNLAGVAIAISLGGPGAVFWMWIIAMIGADR
ncbi:MAG TPA: alanine:cation symporter family protein, partial [Massilibacterium sp.]|nr:alanine:cation symporter family protein [Massilibacterium sp.]